MIDRADYPVATCTTCALRFKNSKVKPDSHKTIIDSVGGNHASQCELCFSARAQTSKSLEYVFKYFAEKAGFIVDVQPSLSKILGEEYDMETLANIFPKKPDGISKQVNKSVKQAIANNSNLSALEQKEAVDAVVNGIPRRPHDIAGSIRPDGRYIPGNYKGTVIIGDARQIHSTADSYCRRQYKSMIKEFWKAYKLWKDGSILQRQEVNTPIVTSAANQKHRMYDTIADLINLQVNINSSALPTKMVPLVVSHRGEFGRETIDFINHLTAKFRHNSRKLFDIDGKTLTQRVSHFQLAFKNSLIAKVATGHARMLRTAHFSGPIARLRS